MQHQNYSNRFGGLQLRLTSQLVSTRLKFIRSDAYSLERTEIEALNREGNQCDDDKVSVNLEKCYMAYTQRQVVHQCKNNFLSRHSQTFFCAASVHISVVGRTIKIRDMQITCGLQKVPPHTTRFLPSRGARAV